MRLPPFRINLPYADFIALENMIAGRSEDQHGVLEHDHEHRHPVLRGRFSRYLKFATRGRGSTYRNEHSYYEQTYPPTPTPPHEDEREDERY